MERQWRMLKTLFFIFGLDSSKKKPAKLIQRIILTVVRLFWDVIMTIFFMSLIYAGLAEISQVFYVHLFDILLLLILRCMLHLRLRNIVSSFERLLRSYKLAVGESRLVVFGLYIFVGTQAGRVVANLLRLFTLNGVLKVAHQNFSFGMKDMLSAPKLIHNMIISGLIVSCNVINDFLPALTVMLCWIIHMHARRLITSYNQMMERVFRQTLTAGSLQYLSATLQDIVSKLRYLNEQLSPIVFILISYWTASIMYMISRIVLQHPYHDTFTSTYSLFCIVNYFLHFVVLVTVGAEIKDSVTTTKRILFKTDKIIQEMFHDAQCPQIQMFAAVLDDAAQQVSVSALGLFDLNRNIVLVNLGIIITYEFLIYQVLETARE